MTLSFWGQTYDARVDGVPLDFNRISGLGRNVAGDIAKGARQVGSGGQVVVIRPGTARQTLGAFEDFISNFKTNPPGESVRVMNEDSLPPLFFQR